MGKSTISMVIFNSYVSHNQRVLHDASSIGVRWCHVVPLSAGHPGPSFPMSQDTNPSGCDLASAWQVLHRIRSTSSSLWFLGPFKNDMSMYGKRGG